MIYLVAFLAGAVSEYYADKWTIRWNSAVQARSYPLGRANMTRHTRRTVLLGWGLLLLGAVDVASIFGGMGLFAAVLAGSLVGSALATQREMEKKYLKKVANLRDEEDE